MASQLRAGLLALTAGLAVLLGGALPAVAHNVLLSTMPGDNQRVARTPPVVVLTFDEPALALGTHVVVTGPAGEVEQGSVRLVNNTVSQDLQPGAPAGSYTVAWRVTSADGHPVAGSFRFTSEAAGADRTVSPSAAPSSIATSPSPGSGPSGGAGVPIWALGVVGVVVIATLGLNAWRLGRSRVPEE